MAESGGASLLFRVVRGSLLLTGFGIFAVGLAIVYVPGLERQVPVESMILLLGSDYFVVAAVGLVAVWIALLVLAVLAGRGIDEASLPVVESVESAPHPGQSIDSDPSDDQRERLRETAVRTLVRTGHCTRSVAERRVGDGSWTEDGAAAEYLADRTDSLFRPSLSDEERIRRTAREIERLGDGTTSDVADGPGEERTKTDERSGGVLSDPIDATRDVDRDVGGPETTREGQDPRTRPSSAGPGGP